MENPSLHLTALLLYAGNQETVCPGGNPQIKEWQDEISNYFSKGSFIAAVQKEGNGIPVVKLNDKEVYSGDFYGYHGICSSIKRISSVPLW